MHTAKAAGRQEPWRTHYPQLGKASKPTAEPTGLPVLYKAARPEGATGRAGTSAEGSTQSRSALYNPRHGPERPEGATTRAGASAKGSTQAPVARTTCTEFKRIAMRPKSAGRQKEGTAQELNTAEQTANTMH